MKILIRAAIGCVTVYGALVFAEMSGIQQMWRRVVMVLVIYIVGLAIGTWIGFENRRGPDG